MRTGTRSSKVWRIGHDVERARAFQRALHRGAIVVAAVGNDRQSGNRNFVPASLPHVLTVGANNEADRVTSFSNRSNALDLVAPGVSIPVAVPTFYDQSGYASFDGTSFSSPLVAGATAWVWTVRPQLDPTQVEDVMRHSARDVGPKGWDADTGFGILSMPAALAEKTPAKDPQEPNDDVKLVRPHAVTASGTRLPTPALLRARLDVTEDPEDRRLARPFVRMGCLVRLPFRHRLRHPLFDALPRPQGPRADQINEHSLDVLAHIVIAKPSDDAFLGKRVGGAAYSLKVSVSRR